MRSSERARVPVAGVAVAGVVAGHALTYIVAVRQPIHREEILTATGHSYWSSAVAVAIVLGFVGLAAVGMRVLGGARERHDPHFTYAAPILGIVQVLSYVAIEVVERFLSRVPVSALINHHELLPIGIVLQLVVALFGGLLLHLLARTLRLVAAAIRAPKHRRGTATAGIARLTVVSLRSKALRCAWGLRGPPGSPVSVVAGI